MVSSDPAHAPHPRDLNDSSLVSSSSLVQNVLSTPELLELILLNVDQRSLLSSVQRTNRYFHDLICTSPHIQEHLFFRARHLAAWNGLEINQAIADLLPIHWNLSCLLKRRRFVWDNRDSVSPAVYQHRNPNLPMNSIVTWVGHVNPRWKRDVAFCRPDASWRRMLLVQPTLIPVDELLQASYLGSTICITSQPLTGELFLLGNQKLTMAEILSLTQQAVRPAAAYNVIFQTYVPILVNPIIDPTPVKVQLVKVEEQLVHLRADFYRILRDTDDVAKSD
ncbi:hypothetical protein G7054_g13306 [Neopestalotiopsis clavispora]|nr:hypothetical protein G7054_g13306 [Neopestalotiopsis clavispora]